MNIFVWLIAISSTIFQVAHTQISADFYQQYDINTDQVIELLEKHCDQKDIDVALDYLVSDDAQFDYESLILPAAMCMFCCIVCCIKKSCILAFPYTKKLPIIRDIVERVNEARASRNASGSNAPTVSAPITGAEENL